MSKPDWCPQDVWEASGGDVTRDGSLANYCAKFCARAILAERERCAKVADTHAEILRSNFARYEAIAVEGVAKAIRGATQ